MTGLSEQEQKVLRMRFGLDDDDPKTLEEIGKVFGVTRERIRQIEAKAIRKLRHPSRLKQLKHFLLHRQIIKYPLRNLPFQQHSCFP